MKLNLQTTFNRFKIFRELVGNLSVRIFLTFCLLTLIVIFVKYQTGGSSKTTEFMRKLNKSYKSAFMYTPYNLVYGGGERVFLTVMKTLIESGYHVDLFLEQHNVCQDQRCITKLGESFDISLNGDMITININSDISDTYTVGFTLGNEKIPQKLIPSSSVNVHICQFPFDGSRLANDNELSNVPKLSSVMLYSHFAEREYVSSFIGSKIPFDIPKTKVIYPMFETPSMVSGDIHDMKTIVVMGRFFEGIQSKRHLLSIYLVDRLEGFSVNLIGGTSKDGYFKHIEEVSQRHNNINVFPNVNEDEKIKILSKSGIYWHLTGCCSKDLIPADVEHFGITVLEAINHGLIPLVFCDIGVMEILLDTEFCYRSVDELLEKTKNPQILMKKFPSLRENVMKRIIKYSFSDEINHMIKDDVVRMILKNQEASLGKKTVRGDMDVVIPYFSPNDEIVRIVSSVQRVIIYNKIIVLTDSRLEDRAKMILPGYCEIRVIKPLLKTIDDYNNYFLDDRTWSQFDGRLLLIQADSYIINHGILPKDEAYIGSPWCEPNDISKHLSIGNGGVSIRDPDEVKKALKTNFIFKMGILDEHHEDVQISYKLSRLKKLAVDSSKACSFSQEVKCLKCRNIKPLFCHKCYEYFNIDDIFELFD